MLWLDDIEVSREGLEVLAEPLIRDDLLEVLIFTLIGVALATKHEGHLLECDGVFALVHDLADELVVVHLLGNSDCIGVPAMLSVNVERLLVSLEHLFRVCCVRRARQQVEAYSLEVLLVGELN